MNEYIRQYEFDDPSLASVKVCQCPDSRYGLGSTVWDAALVMCAFLESEPGRTMIRDAKCIELGAGTGIVSIVASTLGTASAIATDVPACIPFIKQNIGMNADAKNCTSQSLDWTEDLDPAHVGAFDWVLCADCVYEPDSVESLSKTISALKPVRGIILANEQRDTPGNARAEKEFITAMYKEGFVGKAVHRDVIKPEWQCDDIHTVVFTRSLDQVKGA